MAGPIVGLGWNAAVEMCTRLQHDSREGERANGRRLIWVSATSLRLDVADLGLGCRVAREKAKASAEEKAKAKAAEEKAADAARTDDDKL